jgi:hypothetical protein
LRITSDAVGAQYGIRLEAREQACQCGASDPAPRDSHKQRKCGVDRRKKERRTMQIDYAAMLVLTEENRAVAAATAAQPAVQTAQAAADANADPAEPEGKGGGGASPGL